MFKRIALLCSVIVAFARPAIAQDFEFVSIQNLIEQEVGRLLIPEIYKKLGLQRRYHSDAR